MRFRPTADETPGRRTGCRSTTCFAHDCVVVGSARSVSKREEAGMAGVEARAFDAADETRTPAKTKVDLVRLSGTTAARLTLEPGWRWSECIKPVAGTESCQLRHVGVAQSGRLGIS